MTSDDTSPYAAAFAEGRSGWWTMARWVCSAGLIRLKHLALMRRSAASKRFASSSILALSFGLAAFEATRVGWRWVNRTLTGGESPFRPIGNGWLHVIGALSTTPDTVTDRTTDLWWNPAQALIAAPIAILLGFLAGNVVLWAIRAGAAMAHGSQPSGERRMSAATDYSTAWMAPLLAAAAVTAFRPFAYAGAVARWTWYPPQWLLDGAAGMFALMGLVFWWFWLIRLGSTSPAAVRTRVVAFFAAGMPILVTASAYAWNLGFTTFCGRVFRLLNLQI